MNSLHPTRICKLTSVHPYNDIRIFVKECCSLASAGYEVHFIAPGTTDHVENGVIVHSIPVNSSSRFQRMTMTVSKIYNIARHIDADIYQLHDPELLLIGLLLKLQGRRVVYEIHEDFPRDIKTKEYLGLLRYFLSWPVEQFENFASRKLSALVAATPYIGDRFRPLNPNTIVLNNFPLKDELSSPKQIRWEERSNSVAYLGVISESRGIFEMVDAMEYLPKNIDTKLDLAGIFRISEQHEQLSKRPGWQNVIYHGLLDRDEVVKVLGKVKAGLVVLHPLPQFVVSQPIKMFEYMAAGIPVIASDFPIWRDIIEKSQCGLLVDPENPREIAGAIEYLLSNPIEAERMGQQGRQAVLNCYNWEAELPILYELYTQLLKN